MAAPRDGRARGSPGHQNEDAPAGQGPGEGAEESNRPSQDTTLSGALTYAARGWRVHPLPPRRKHPPRWSDWPARATTDPDVIRAWWSGHADDNVAVAAGHESGTLVLDVDGEPGQASISGRELPPTPTIRTARGWQYVYRWPWGGPQERTTRAGILPGVDTRGQGGYHVVPPSVHPTGAAYAWAPGLSPDETELADPPAWLVELLAPREAPRAEARPGNGADPDPLPYDPADRRARSIVTRIVAQAAERTHRHPERGRHAQCLRVGGDLRRAGLGPEWARHAVERLAELVRETDTAGVIVPVDIPGETRAVEHGWRAAAGDAPPTPGTEAPAPFTAADLAHREFPEPKWAVPGVLPEGLSLFAGKPKVGKSWLALGLGVAVASGGVALGTSRVEAGDVLYLALEDTPRRLKKRLATLAAFPERLHLVTDWPRGAEACEALKAWLTDHPGARLVAVDTLARIRAEQTREQNAYAADYEAVAALKAVADAHGVALLLIHHLRKMGAADPFDTVSGTLGLSGAADSVLILAKEHGRADAFLHLRGRDVEEADLALEWRPDTCTWHGMGDAEEFKRSRERQEVIDLLRDKGPLSRKDITAALGKPYGTVGKLLWTMAHAGELHHRVDGRYTPMWRGNGNPLPSSSSRESECSRTGNDGNGSSGSNSGTAGNTQRTVTTVTGTHRGAVTEQPLETQGMEDVRYRVTAVTGVVQERERGCDDDLEGQP